VIHRLCMMTINASESFNGVLKGARALPIQALVVRTWDLTPQRDLQFYKNELDMIDRSAIVWEPYHNDVLQTLASVCREGSQIWRARTPLICFQNMEMYVPDRVLHQFGFH